MIEEAAGPRLYVIADAGEAAAARLRACLAAADIATVLLVPPAGRPADATELKTLVELIQGDGVAALILDDARLARTLRADGVHISPGPDIAQRYAEAREILGTRYIVGADAGLSRHDAMTVGEAGADYVAFSLPPAASAEDEDAELELLQWWSEIFEVPCVAFGPGAPEEARVAGEAGADFVAIRIPEGAAADAAQAIAEYAAALGGSAPVAASS